MTIEVMKQEGTLRRVMIFINDMQENVKSYDKIIVRYRDNFAV